MSGEGKTFIASNLAVSLALLGKKVIIVGLDIRKPGLNKVFRIHHKEKGITGFLSAPQSTDLRSMILPSEVSNNLHVLPGGTIPPNPTELLARKSLDDAIELLKKDYDYVVLDTAPIGMVTDTQLIARVADISVYVCRADYTHKNDYQLINELYANKRLPGLCTVINGLDMKKRSTATITATASMAGTTATARNTAMATGTVMAILPIRNRYSPHKPGELLHAMLSLFPGLFFVVCLYAVAAERCCPAYFLTRTDVKNMQNRIT